MDSTLCQTDADSTETLIKSAGDSDTVSIHDVSGSSFRQEESLDSLDTSGNRTADNDVTSPFKTLMESPQPSNSSTADSGFSSRSVSTTSPSSVGSLNLLRSESSNTVVDMELDTPIEMKIEEMKAFIDDGNIKIGKGGFGVVYKGIHNSQICAFDFLFSLCSSGF